MVAAAARSDTIYSLQSLTSFLKIKMRNSKSFYNEAKKAEVKEEFDRILELGDEERAGDQCSCTYKGC